MFEQQQLDNHKKLNQQKTSLKRLSTSSNILAKLNQRAINVEQSISSLYTQRLEYLSSLNEKTRDLERVTAAFEYSSSKNL